MHGSSTEYGVDACRVGAGVDRVHTQRPALHYCLHGDRAVCAHAYDVDSVDGMGVAVQLNCVLREEGRA